MLGLSESLYFEAMVLIPDFASKSHMEYLKIQIAGILSSQPCFRDYT